MPLLKLHKGMKSLQIEIYDERVILVTSKRQVNYLLKHNDFDDDTKRDMIECLDYLGACVRLCYGEESYKVMIVLNNSLGTLAHEATHVADRIMEYRGLEGTEARAHIVGYVVERFSKGWKK